MTAKITTGIKDSNARMPRYEVIFRSEKLTTSRLWTIDFPVTRVLDEVIESEYEEWAGNVISVEIKELG